MSPLSDDPFASCPSSVYDQWMAERKEVLAHKWVLSERAGQDVGYDFAVWDWVKKHRQGWLDAWRAKQVEAKRVVSPEVTSRLNPPA